MRTFGRIEGLERLERAAQRVAEPERHPATTPTSAVALMVRPAPSSPDRLPVEAWTATARRVDAQQLGDGRAHPLQPGATQPRPGAHDGQVERRGPQPAGASRATTCAQQLPAVDAPGPGSPAGNSRPRSPSRGRGQQPVTHRVERRVAIGVAVEPGRLGDVEAAQPQAVRGCRRGGCRLPQAVADGCATGAVGQRPHQCPGRTAR